MKFGPVPVHKAQGAILAHGTMVVDPGAPGAPARRLRKGTVLSAQHVAHLMASGLKEVIVARLDPGDVTEDAAAEALARAVCGDGLTAGVPGTGRVNLRAGGPGIVALDRDAIDAVNRVDPGITLATVPPWQRMEAGGLVATIKIIPFAVPEAALAQACARASGALSLMAPQIATATLIETRVDAADPSPKGRGSIAARLERLGVTLEPRLVVAHEAGAIAQALTGARGDLLLILTGSATCDPRDVAPEAVRQAGGRVLHYGMPVDPGNLLFLGEVAGAPVIGLPGCARSIALNGADWVVERVICSVPLDQIDIPAMGVGGLLKEIPTRPRPRE